MERLLATPTTTPALPAKSVTISVRAYGLVRDSGRRVARRRCDSKRAGRVDCPDDGLVPGPVPNRIPDATSLRPGAGHRSDSGPRTVLRAGARRGPAIVAPDDCRSSPGRFDAS